MKEFGKVYMRKNLKVNAKKSEVVVVVVSVEGNSEYGIWLDGERLEGVQLFKYLSGILNEDGDMSAMVYERVRRAKQIVR